MMAEICVLVGLGLVICGLIIAYATRKKHNEKSNESPPPLPPRPNLGAPSTSASQAQASASRSIAVRSLPPRRSSVSETASVIRRTLETCSGPRGVKPMQFPCCPFCKQRNVHGDRQVIFWDSVANCYRCSRGHQFKSNGKLL